MNCSERSVSFGKVGHQRGRTAGCGAGSGFPAENARGGLVVLLWVSSQNCPTAGKCIGSSLNLLPYDGIANGSQDWCPGLQA